MSKRAHLASFSLILLAALPAAAEVVVVVGAKTPATALAQKQVADIFLGRTTSLPGGASAVLVDLPESNALREEFYMKLTGKSAAQAKAYWAKLAFTGKGIPPTEVGSSAEVKKAVAATPGGIGYIDKGTIDDTVKVVFGGN